MIINKSIINDACAGFLATAYQLAAQDELRCAFSVVRGSGIYEEKLAQISHINNRSDYDSFLKGLSDTDELSEAAVQYFAERWKAKIEPCLEAIEKRMQPELDHPFLDCRSVVRKIERWAMLALGFDITDHEKYPQSEELEIVENLEGYKQLLKEQVAKQIKNIADTPFERRTGKNRFMPGDIVTLNRERSLEAFVHDKEDLDCIHGETIEFKFSDPAPVAEFLYKRFVYDKRKNGSVEGATLRISSDRPEHSGKLVTFDVPFDDLGKVVSNSYKDMVEREGAEAASARIVDRVFNNALDEGLEKSREAIRKWHKMPYDYHVKGFMLDHCLTKEQLDALRDGKEVDYNFPASRRKTVFKNMFGSLALLASRSIGYKIHKTLEPPSTVVDERSFMKYISQLMRDIVKVMDEQGDEHKEEHREEHGEEQRNEHRRPSADNNLLRAAALIKTQLDVAAQILVREYKQVTLRYKDQFRDYDSPMLTYTFERITDSTKITAGKIEGDFSIDRAVMYLDHELYQKDPFSPPSEGRIKSVKLTVSEGCKYGGCNYCTAYRHKKDASHIHNAGKQQRFTATSPAEFREHCLRVREALPKFGMKLVDRLFLGSGDILWFSASEILDYVDIAKEIFDGYSTGENVSPINIKQVSGFARTNSIACKSVEELREIVEHGLNMIFWGVETGSDAVLKYVQKGSSHHNMEIAAEKLLQTDMKVSVMIMPGIGGLKHYEDHVVKTAEILNKIVPHYIALLAINPNPITAYAAKMDEESARGENMALTEPMVVEQIYDIARLLNPERWKQYGRTCVVSAPLKPADKVAKNPLGVAFKINSKDDKMDYQTELRNMFHGFFCISQDFMPSALIPVGDFNCDSRIREFAYRI